ncbi:ATP-grasp domain-containing protein [Paraburkholderia bannensis]|uniref:ATP-grasp domain-containing protein n=1 Tax=Paraburkholderia bannensis TaxID=765414 RepID=UPI002AB6D762|nr:ATP-grasp domain-containing protein [Paraburkholderia bannensis]
MSHVAILETTRTGIQLFAIARERGVRTTFITSGKFDSLYPAGERDRLYSLSSEVIHVADSQNVDLVASALRVCHAQHPIDAVFSCLALCAFPAAEAAFAAGLRGTSPIGVQNARTKPLCRALLQAHGIPSLAYAVVHTVDQAFDALESIGYPAIIKPVTGVAKFLTSIVQTPRDVERHFAESKASYVGLNDYLRKDVALEFIVEELAVGPLYSLEVGVSEVDEWMPLAIVRRKTARINPVLEVGSTIPSGLDEIQYRTVSEYGRRIMQALQLDIGIFHMEFIYTEHGPRLIEVNPRIAGGTIPDLVRTATGVNLFEILLKIYLGDKVGVDRLRTHLACSQTYLCAEKDCIVDENLSSDWFERFRDQIIDGRADIRAGQKLNAHSNNFGAYGVVSVTAQSYELAVEKASSVHRDIMSTLNLALLEAI